MPNIAAGIGLLGLGVMVVVAVGTIAYSLFYDEPPPFSHSHDDGPYSRRNNERSAWSSSTSDPTTLRRRKKKERTSPPAFVCSDSCSICKETIESDVLKKLPCNHCFHCQCIRDWFDSCTRTLSQKTGTCPMCRLDFSSQDLI